MKNRTILIRHLFPGLPSLLMLFVSGCSPSVALPSGNDMEILDSWLDENIVSPADLAAQTIVSGRSVILAQDDAMRGDTSMLVEALLPTLHDVGISTVGVFFMDVSVQADLDEFILSDPADNPSDNPALKAKSLLRAADASLGYAEYCGFLETVNRFNSRLSGQETPIRVAALGRNGQLDIEILAKIVQGWVESEEEEETEVVTEAAETRSDPAEPVFLWLLSSQTASAMEAWGEGDSPDEDSSQGNAPPAILRHHSPVPGEGLRWDGLIESVAAERDLRDRTFAFYTEQAPIPGWPESGIDADIYAVTPYPYRGVTPIPDFISPEYATEARRFFPDMSMEKPLRWLSSRMNHRIERAARKYAKSLPD
ncbi:MAG: hypothetical protein RQ801_02355 [Spirochaetaceae bacterium]|nr:hypothetical protein [Spirochaetaceae bacterium]MDT8297117.1 hypothetical protein [Spirochaetaceae bacterium]